MLSSINFGSSQPTRQVADRGSFQGPPSPSPTNPNGPNPWGSDSVSLSSEASQEAAVDPNRCGNDWRCLDQLQKRGLLA
ncbi:MAG: hypothetical protein KF760_28900 [Candidatus Eremiobacteraeota bacterium]|nr:hypothetical protein [Candidatus Eremiobacteraeota bacterium]MCW5866009.1 hypothetical protein [Candidatus Eremiobacteraeota bacterium]